MSSFFSFVIMRLFMLCVQKSEPKPEEKKSETTKEPVKKKGENELVQVSEGMFSCTLHVLTQTF